MCTHSVKFSDILKKSFILKQYLKHRLLHIVDFPLGHVRSPMKNCRYAPHLHTAPFCGFFQHRYETSHFLVLGET